MTENDIGQSGPSAYFLANGDEVKLGDFINAAEDEMEKWVDEWAALAGARLIRKGQFHRFGVTGPMMDEAERLLQQAIERATPFSERHQELINNRIMLEERELTQIAKDMQRIGALILTAGSFMERSKVAQVRRMLADIEQYCATDADFDGEKGNKP